MFLNKNLSQEEKDELLLEVSRQTLKFHQAFKDKFDPDTVFIVGRDRTQILANGYGIFFSKEKTVEQKEILKKLFLGELI